MVADLDLLLTEYESGVLSRRDLLSALAAAFVPSVALAPRPTAPRPTLGLARQLNHVTIRVANVERSRAFYQELFGMPVLTRVDPGINLRIGSSFLGLAPTPPNAPATIDHFCLGMDSFEPESIRRGLRARGLEVTIRARGETKELYFTDPDGITVQLQDAHYRGGVGPLGDRVPK